MLALAQDERAGQRLGDPLGDADRVTLIHHVLGQDRELVAAEAGHRVAGAHGLLQPRGDCGEKLVAGRVSQRVVDELELVEVEEEDGDRSLLVPRASQRVLETVEEEVAVRQAGEGIVEGVVAVSLLGVAALDRVRQHVGERLEEAHVLVGVVADREALEAEDAPRFTVDSDCGADAAHDPEFLEHR